MAVQDIVTLRIVGRYQSQNIVNTLHYRITDQAAAEKDILDNLISQWDTAIQAAWLARCIDSYMMVGYKAFNHTGVGKTPAFLHQGSLGTVTGEEVPSPVCRTITLYTGSANYRRRGRVMLSGGETAMFNITDGAVSNSEVTALQTLADLLIVPLASGGDEFQLGLPPTGASSWDDFVSARPRVTPALISSRRVSQFLIG